MEEKTDNSKFVPKKLLIAAGVVLVTGISFAGGMALQRRDDRVLLRAGAGILPPKPGAPGFNSGGGYSRGFGGVRRGRVFGTVDSLNGTTSMVVKTNGGSTVTVSFSANPIVLDANGNTVAASTIKPGDNVVVAGTPQSDGSIVAQQVRLNPAVTPVSGMPTTNTPQPL